MGWTPPATSPASARLLATLTSKVCPNHVNLLLALTPWTQESRKVPKEPVEVLWRENHRGVDAPCDALCGFGRLAAKTFWNHHRALLAA